MNALLGRLTTGTTFRIYTLQESVFYLTIFPKIAIALYASNFVAMHTEWKILYWQFCQNHHCKYLTS